MGRVIVGVDPHKNSVTIEAVDGQGRVVARGRFGTDAAGYRMMRGYVRGQWPHHVWAVEGAHTAWGGRWRRGCLAQGETVVEVPAKLAARVRVFETGNARMTDAVDVTGSSTCVPWAGTFHEVLAPLPRPHHPRRPGARQRSDRRLHRAHPRRPIAADLVGDYREKLTGIATESIDEPSVAQYRLRSTLLGSDGSSLDYSLSGKVTVDAKGVARLERHSSTCE